MPRALWLADVVADAFRGVSGFRVETYSSWNRRGSTTFDPEGVMDHHTGRGGYDALLRYMMENAQYAPLCNIATSRPSSGVVRITVCNAGRANHAGRGELPWRRGQGSTGNRRTIGIEHQNDGAQSWPAQQMEAARRLDAALLKHMKQPVSRMLDHKTYTSRKVDRHTINVVSERQNVQRLLDGGTLAPGGSLMLSPCKFDDRQSDAVTALQVYLRVTLGLDIGSFGSKNDGVDGHYGGRTASGLATALGRSGDVRSLTYYEIAELQKRHHTGGGSSGLTQTQADKIYAKKGATITVTGKLP